MPLHLWTWRPGPGRAPNLRRHEGHGVLLEHRAGKFATVARAGVDTDAVRPEPSAKDSRNGRAPRWRRNPARWPGSSGGCRVCHPRPDGRAPRPVGCRHARTGSRRRIWSIDRAWRNATCVAGISCAPFVARRAVRDTPAIQRGLATEMQPIGRRRAITRQCVQCGALVIAHQVDRRQADDRRSRGQQSDHARRCRGRNRYSRRDAAVIAEADRPPCQIVRDRGCAASGVPQGSRGCRRSHRPCGRAATGRATARSAGTRHRRWRCVADARSARRRHRGRRGCGAARGGERGVAWRALCRVPLCAGNAAR